jgi:hypothetical protein
MDLRPIRYVTFDGGGVLGRRYVGLLLALRRYIAVSMPETSYDAWLHEVEGVAGTSVGAIFALGFLLNVPDQKMCDLVEETNSLSAYMKRPDIGLTYEHFGLDDGSGIRDIVSGTLCSVGIAPTITLRDLRRLTRKRYVAIAVDVNSNRVLELSAETTPDMRVIDAVYASCAVPLLYVPLTVGEHLLVDGGLLQNRPASFSGQKCLNFAVHHSSKDAQHPRPADAFEYIMRVLWVVCSTQTPPPSYGVVCCSRRGDTSPLFSLRDIGREEIQECINDSYALAMNQLMGNRLFETIAQVAERVLECNVAFSDVRLES